MHQQRVHSSFSSPIHSLIPQTNVVWRALWIPSSKSKGTKGHLHHRCFSISALRQRSIPQAKEPARHREATWNGGVEHLTVLGIGPLKPTLVHEWWVSCISTIQQISSFQTFQAKSVEWVVWFFPRRAGDEAPPACSQSLHPFSFWEHEKCVTKNGRNENRWFWSTEVYIFLLIPGADVFEAPGCGGGNPRWALGVGWGTLRGQRQVPGEA